MRKIINFFSFVLLVVAIGAISWFTVYTLNNEGIREEVENKIFKNIEMISSNMTKNALTEIFNVYLNDEKHKIKFDYNVTIVDDVASIDLVAYLDGKSVLSENIARNIPAKDKDIEGIFLDDNISKYVRISEKRLQIINFKDNAHLLIDLGSFDKFYKEKFYLVNGEAEHLFSEGIVVQDDSVNYVDSEEKKLDFFYDKENQVTAKVENNEIYALVLVEKKDLFDFKEYKYTYEDGALVAEVINTYVEIKRENSIIVE